MKKNMALILLLMISSLYSCNDILEVEPKGILNEEQVSTIEGAEGFVIAAYSSLGNDEINQAFSMYHYGNIRSNDAYKGGGGTSDGDVFHAMETFVYSRPDQWNYNGIWYYICRGIKRANDGLRVLDQFTEAEYPDVNVREAELRFLRGYWYLMLENLFKNIPYIDETILAVDYKKIPNNQFTRDEILEKIAADFEFAASVLPESQKDIGRANQFAAYAYLAKTRIYQAYEQNENHDVININAERLSQVIQAVDNVLASPYRLEFDFANNFLPGSYENGVESIMAVQFSKDDGVGSGRLNYGDMLTVPQGLGCCDFQKPSQTLVNAFQTTSQGVPLFDAYNQQNIDFTKNTVDPRLDHTISRPGAPWKYDSFRIVTESWSRNAPIYGCYNSMKENVSPDCDCFVNVDPFYGTTKNRILIRLADVMLFKAEALIELGRHGEALPLINEIRTRAANSTSRLVGANGQPTSNYNIQPYEPGVNINWTQENARKAMRFERRLEMALEGGHFFDMMRWGVADIEMNAFFDVERPTRSIYNDAKFTKGRDEYLPIPQEQINLSEGLYVQNPGY